MLLSNSKGHAPIQRRGPRFHSAYLLQCDNGATVRAYLSARKLPGAPFDALRPGNFQPAIPGLFGEG